MINVARLSERGVLPREAKQNVSYKEGNSTRTDFSKSGPGKSGPGKTTTNAAVAVDPVSR